MTLLPTVPRKSDTVQSSAPFDYRWAKVGNLVVAALLGIAVLLHGRPMGIGTWIVFALITMAGVVLGTKHRLWFLAPLAFAVHTILPLWLWFLPSESAAYFDMRSGRRAAEIPPGLFLGGNGINTRLIESYLGYRDPMWRHSHYISRFIRDGDNRLDVKNIIHHEGLREAIAMLPDDDSRRQVLLCLTEPTNHLRVHQSLLLVALVTFGYPRDSESGDWWKSHRDLFIVQPDLKKAATTVVGWRVAIQATASKRFHDWPFALSRQIRAARNQELNEWDADLRFSDEYRAACEQRGFDLTHADANECVPPTNIAVWD